MKAEDIKKGHTYNVRVGKHTVTAVVLEIAVTRPERPLHNYTVRDVHSNKVSIVRSPGNFVEEVVKVPEPEQVVRVVSGVVVGSLSAERTYRVKKVGVKYVILADGKKDHKVLISDVRVVDNSSPISGGSKQRSDPTMTDKDIAKSAATSSSTGTSRGVPRTSVRTAGTVDVEQPSLVPEVDDDPVCPKCSAVPCMCGDSIVYNDYSNGTEGEESSDPTVPTTETDTAPDATTASGSSNGSLGSAGFDLHTRLVLRAANDETDPDQGEAQQELHRLAVSAGHDPRHVDDAPSWEYVVDMIRNPSPFKEERLSPKRPVFDGQEPSHQAQFSDSIADACEYPEHNYVSPGDDEPSRLVTSQPTKRQLAALPSPQKSDRVPLSQRLGLGKTVVDDSPHLIVEARAGSGKTTTIIEGLKLMLGQETTLTPSPQQRAVWDAMLLSKGKAKSFCMVAFNKSIATELQRRVPPGVTASTMHSMGNSAVCKAFGRVKVESGRVSNVVATLLGRDLRDLKKDRFEMVKAVEDLVGMCKMNLVEGDDTEALAQLVSHYEIEVPPKYESEVFALVPQVLEQCKDVNADKMIDFNDMIYLPVVLNLAMQRYDVLLVDESQDLNRCQQALAKMAGRRLILVGDPKQAVYGFAGADSESMARMYNELVPIIKEGDRGCTHLPLTVTRRCGREIVKEANKIVPDLEAFGTNPEGKVSRAPYTDKASKLTLEEKKLNPPDDYTKLVQDGDFVLCRVNAPLVSQCFRFLKMGRKAVIQGRDIGKGLVKLIDNFKAVDVPDLVRQLSDWHNAERTKENAKRFPSEGKLINLSDKYECLVTFTEGVQTVEDVRKKIESVFSDDGTTGVRFSSVHRAKGLEANRVFLLQPEGAKMPHPLAKSKWQKEQEMNCLYIAITRAKEELIHVS